MQLRLLAFSPPCCCAGKDAEDLDEQKTDLAQSPTLLQPPPRVVLSDTTVALSCDELKADHTRVRSYPLESWAALATPRSCRSKPSKSRTAIGDPEIASTTHAPALPYPNRYRCRECRSAMQ